MASTYEYIISLQDKVSGTMQRIVGASSATVGKLTALSDKARTLQGVTGDLSGSMFQLKQRIDLLQQEKELLDPSNLNLIKQYNQEIDRLSGRIEHLDNAGRGGKLKDYLGEIGGMVRGVINPVTLGAAAIGFSGKSAMNFREGMAKVNITAQLDEKGLSDLESEIKGIAKDNKFDISVAPGAFEQIVSQTADVDMSLDVLDAALKGSKAGFTDLSTVAGALAQTMSILGGSASSLEMLDTFFAAKRVGAGEFKDFATYMPGLIASADTLGVKYKSVAGVFAYMTGKGQDAARASVLMGNMFSSLSKSDITKNLDKAGVKIFDAQGKMRDFVDIFRDLGSVMAGMSDQQKTAFLEKVGIVDKEAKAAFAIMGSDLDKLTESMKATANATGETNAALEFSKNPIQTVTELWNQFKGIGLQIGDILLPVICGGLSVLGHILSGVSAILNGVISFFSGWVSYLQEGNPLVWGITAALGALTVALIAYEMWTNRAAIATKAKAVWDGIVAAATGGWTTVQWALNASLYACPLVWIVALIIGLIAAIVACCTKVQGWGKQWDVIVQFMKNVWELFVETFKFRWNVLTNGFMLGLDKIKLGWYKFKKAVGLGDSAENQAMIAQINTDVENRKQAMIDGANKVKELARKTADSLSWELSWKKDETTGENRSTPGTEEKPGMLPGSGTLDFDSLIKKMGKSSDQKSEKKVIDLNEAVTNNKGDTAYSAIASRLAMVKIPPAAVAPVKVITPAPGVPVNNINVPGAVAPVVNVDNTDYTGKDKTDVLQGIAENVSGIRSILDSGLKIPVSAPATPVNNINISGTITPVVNVDNTDYTGKDKTEALQGIAENVSEIRSILGSGLKIPVSASAAPVNNINIPESAAPVVNVDNTGYTGKDKREMLQDISEKVSGIRSMPGGGLASPVTSKPEARDKTVYLRGIHDSVIRLQGIAAAIAAVITVGGMNPVNPVAIPPVTQISMPEVPAAMTTEMPVLAAAPELPLTERQQDKATTLGNKPVMYLDKYCEQVVINIQNTDQRGTDEIRETIRETLTDIFDPYEA